MRNQLTVYDNIFECENNVVIASDDSIVDMIQRQFAEWPTGARIYYESINEDNDVTPTSEADIERLMKLNGDFYVVLYPEEPTTFTIIYAVISVVLVAAAYLMAPKVPNATQRNTNIPSPNNELSARSNQARPNGRIPDIFGTVRSTPDLISVPYSVYENNIEIEHATMCIGRGSYQIHDSKDASTDIAIIPESTVQVYRPNADIYSDNFYYSVGAKITDAPLNVIRQSSVNGQTMEPTNLGSWVGDQNASFHTDGVIRRQRKPGMMLGPDFNSVFTVGDLVRLENTAVYASDWIPVADGLPVTPICRVLSQTSILVPLDDTSSDAFLASNGTHISLVFDLDPPDGMNYGVQYSSAPRSYYLAGTYPIVSVTRTPDGLVFVMNTSSNSEWAQAYADAVAGSIDPVNWIAEGTGVSVQFGTPLFDVNGTDYKVMAVDADSIQLWVNGTAAHPNWPTGFVPSADPFASPILTRINERSKTIIGPFTLGSPAGTMILTNFVAGSGLYKDDGVNQYAAEVTIEVTATPVDATGVAIGPDEIYNVTLTGSSETRTPVAKTLLVTTSRPGRYNVKAKRITETDKTFAGQVVDEVKWKDLYQAYPADHYYGDVTIVRARTVATTGALSVKDRKLNLLVTREIRQRVSGETFTSTLSPTNAADAILAHIVTDPKIGSRGFDEIDVENVYSTVQAVRAYFGTVQAAEFCYTFDKDMTYEETVQVVANAVFCTAYRRGAELRLAFERKTDDSTLLFNHRNKVPKTDKRSVRFGTDANYDGVHYLWINPEDDAVETMKINDGVSNKPKKIESIGVRNRVQAAYHANRAWNKIKYQYLSTEFVSIAHGELVVVGDRVLVADNTRSAEADGDIIAQNGLVVTTSQPITMEPGGNYALFLQMFDGTVQTIPVMQLDSQRLALQIAPIYPLVVDSDKFMRTTYILIRDTDVVQRAFLIAERAPSDANTVTVSAVNYDDRYYLADTPQAPIGLGYTLGEHLGGTY